MVDCPQALVLPFFGVQPSSAHVLDGETAPVVVAGADASTVAVVATVVATVATVLVRQLKCGCRLKKFHLRCQGSETDKSPSRATERYIRHNGASWLGGR